MSGALPPSSRRIGFRCFAAANGENFSDARRAGEVDAAHGAMRDESFDDRGSAGGIVSENVDHAMIEASLAKHGADQAMGGGADFRCLQDDCVSAGERHGDGADSEDDGAFQGAMPSTTPTG